MQKVDGVPVDYSGLGCHRETMRLYIEKGIAPGSGISAILRNDLRAVVMVDEDTLQDLPNIYRWLVNHAPSLSWGSPEKVRAWHVARQAERNPQVHQALRGAVNAASEGQSGS